MSPNRIPRFLGILPSLILLGICNSAYPQSPEDYTRSWCDIYDHGIPATHGFGIIASFNSSGYLGHYSPAYFCEDLEDTADWHGWYYYPGEMTGAVWHAGPWIGAITMIEGRRTPLVTTAYLTQVGYYSYGETCFDTTNGNRLWRTSIVVEGEPNRRFFDDDGDGRIDEDELDGADNDGDWMQIRDDLNHDGRPNHGEPNVDEDYGAVSEDDLGMAFRDSFPEAKVPNHIPLSVKVFMKSYAWKDRVKEPIVPIEYTFVNAWQRELDSVYLGFFVSQHLYGSQYVRITEYPTYESDIRTVISQAFGDSTIKPAGLSLLGTSHPMNQLQITFDRWEGPSEPIPETDELRYRAMSAGSINTNPIAESVNQYLISIGPFGTMHPGDTLKLALALVGGDYPTEGRNNVRSNAVRALELYSRNYAPPLVPPSPPLKVVPSDGYVTLDWHWYERYKSPNPEETWDDSNHYVQSLSDTSWRRRNPPPGKTAGGRVFEAYRIWRSEYPVFKENAFSLLKQFDVNDELDFEGQTGLRHTFTDSMVVRGKKYWYAVTSVNIPDYIITFDTLVTEPMESALHENAVSYQVPFETSTELGKVIVVPNPYRTDIDYTHEGGGWEGLGRNWDETKRLIWFIHLPARCTIRIFSLAGEVVKTITHDDAYRVASGLSIGQEEFYLLSESNRALASGVYVYTVESEYGKQIGKFVVIR